MGNLCNHCNAMQCIGALNGHVMEPRGPRPCFSKNFIGCLKHVVFVFVFPCLVTSPSGFLTLSFAILSRSSCIDKWIMPTGYDCQKIHIIEILQEMLLIEVLGFPNGFDEEVGIYEIL